MRQVAYALRRVSGALARLELLACQVLIVAFTALLIANVVSRYVFNRPFYFAEELAVYMLIWMAFLATCLTIARHDMIKLGLVLDALPRTARRLANVVTEAFVLAMVAAVLYASWNWINSPSVAFERALTLNMPKLPFLTIIPIFSVLALIHVISNLLSLIALDDEEVGVN